MIVIPINLINLNDRRIFTTENGIVMGYKKVVSLDTVHNNIKFPKALILYLIEKYKPLWKMQHIGNGYYNYYLHICLKIYPYNIHITNCQIQLQQQLLRPLAINDLTNLKQSFKLSPS